MKRTPFCIAQSAVLVCALALAGARLWADDWPQWRGPNRDGVWHETGIIEKFDKPQLDVLWRVPLSSGYCGPTVANGRLYVADRVTSPTQMERVHCFDAETGRRIWSQAYDCPYVRVQYTAGPRASITIDEGRAYCLGTMGHLFCFDAANGDILWSKDPKAEYKVRVPIWGIAAAPLVVDDRVVVHLGGRDGACVVAFDKKTGQEKWRALDDPPSYSAPILIEQAGQRVVVCWTGERVVGLDPLTGALCWEHPYPPRPGHGIQCIATPVLHGDYLFVSSFFEGSLLLKLDQSKLAVEPVWRRMGQSERNTDSLHCCISTPVLLGDCIYGVDSYGELRCLELLTGNRVWESLEAVPQDRWSTIHFIQNGDKVWMFNERGELIISRLSPQGFEEISRAQLIKPTTAQLPRRGGVCWTHPAFANRRVYVRNDEELVCADLSAK